MICSFDTKISLNEEVVIPAFRDATLKYDTNDTLLFKPRPTKIGYPLILARVVVKCTFVLVPMLIENISNSMDTIQKESVIAEDQQVIILKMNEPAKQQPH